MVRWLFLWNVVLSVLLIIVLVIGINNINAIGENRSNAENLEYEIDDVKWSIDEIKEYNKVLHAYIEAENSYLNLIRTEIAPDLTRGGYLFPFPPFTPPPPK